ncbi:MAG TPA: SWIB/MDM2 domain-containing protein [Methylobacterium sp.]|jgi:chromatin remodeling complex protein RSC6
MATKTAPKKDDKPAAPKAKKAAAPKTASAGAKPNALQQPLKPSAELAAVVGAASLPRGEVVSKVWEYIKKHNLQNPENKREILADDKLKKIFGKDKCSMFEMNKHLAAHLKSA